MIVFLAIFGIIISIIILLNPFFGLLLIVALMPQAIIQALGGTFLGIFTSVTPIKIIGGLTFVSAFIRHGSDKRVWSSFKKPQMKFFLLFVLWIFISGFTQPGFVTRENFTIFTSFLIFLFIVASLVDTIQRFRIVIWAGLISVLIISFGSILTYLGMNTGEAAVRISGAGYGPNEFAIGLLPFIAIAFYNVSAENSKILKLTSFIISILAIIALIFTFSRGSIIGFLIMMFFVVVKAKKKLVAIILAIIALALLFNFMPSYIWERVSETQNTIQNLDTTSNVDSTKRRYLLAKAAWEMFLDHPLFGVGIGNYYYESRQYQDVFAGRAHNMYLEIMAEMGIIGIFLFLGILYNTLRTLRNLMRSVVSKISSYACGLYIGLIGFLTSAFFLHAQQEKVLWFIIFMTLVLEYIANQANESRPI